MSGVNNAKRSQYLRHWLLSMPLVAMPLLLGGARPWLWGSVVALFFVGIITLLWLDYDFGSHAGFPDLSNPPASKIWPWVLGVLLAFPLLQTLPVPFSWLAVFSPPRFEWLPAVMKITGVEVKSASISYVPFATAMDWVFLLFLAIYAVLLGKTLRNEGSSKWLWNVLFVFAGIEAFYGLLQVLIPSLGVLWVSPGDGNARGTFINRNHYAAFLGMVWPVLLAYLLSLRKGSIESTEESFGEKERNRQVRQKQMFLIFVVGLVLLALFFSHSRGGIIGSLVSLTVLVGFGRVEHRGLGAFVAICWMIMFAYGGIIGFDEILARFDKLSEGDPSRFLVWKDTWRLIQDHWLTGTGLGTYGKIIGVYQSHLTDQLEIGHAHNDYLQLAAELGLPVAVGVVLLVWGYWWRCVWRIRKVRGLKTKGGRRRIDAGRLGGAAERVERSGERTSRRSLGADREGGLDAERRLIAVGALAGAAAFLCHSWVEFNWQIPANQLYFVMLLVFMGRGMANSKF